MKRIGIILFFLGGSIFLALGVASMTGLSLEVSIAISLTASVLVLLMIDRPPQVDPKAATLIRLIRPAPLRKTSQRKR